ncbi:MAG: hypothetical protein EOS11_18310 [Mesorhizobium sp.]|nr:MAG: hypothetical protein EOS11_18310 [Mesorhizobium sp.]
MHHACKKERPGRFLELDWDAGPATEASGSSRKPRFVDLAVTICPSMVILYKLIYTVVGCWSAKFLLVSDVIAWGSGDIMNFFDKPILNSPYAPPARHWELDLEGRPTDVIMEARPLSALDHTAGRVIRHGSFSADEYGVQRRPRDRGKPKSGRIAVKVINHLGDEVMKVLTV